jgi:uncharacterized protein
MDMNCDDKLTFCFLDKYLYVSQSTIPNAGKGLFARRAFADGAVIGEYTGERLGLEALKNVATDKTYYIQTMEYYDSVKKKTIGAHIIDGIALTNKMRWINDPRYYPELLNATMKQDGRGRVFVYATRLITANEEIFMSYGDDYWRQEDENKLKKWTDY